MRSLEQVDYPEESWQIVILDNPSPQGRAMSFLERDWLPKSEKTLPKLHLIASETNTGFSGGHEAAYQQTKNWLADYVYLLNQDATVEPTFLRHAVQAAEMHPEVALVQSFILLKPTPDLVNSRGNALHFLGFGYCLDYKKPIEKVDVSKSYFYTSGAGVLIRSKVLDEIGLFEPKYFMYHEDVDISWRARLAGYEIVTEKNSVVYHGYEFSRSMQKFFWMERNRHLTNIINYKILTLILIAPATIIMELGTFLFALKSGWWKEKLQSWLAFLKPSTWKLIRIRRRHLATFRRRSDLHMLSFMTAVIDNQEVDSPIMSLLVNPFMCVYFWILKRIVRW